MIREFLREELGLRRFHFVGIGGVGMSALAEILAQSGFEVSGSDLEAGSTVQRLRGLGVRVEQGHRASHLGRAQVVVFSTAVPPRNPELEEARLRSLPRVHRSEVLAELMRDRIGIAVSGTHGKTTTTAMLAQVLVDAGVDPTALIGARLDRLGGNARLGQGKIVVTEADESDRSFLRLPAICSVVTNIDRDHMDVYRDVDDLQEAFLSFMNRVPFYGSVVACSDDPRLAEVLRRVDRPLLTYGLDSPARLKARSLILESSGSRFECCLDDEGLGTVELAVCGRHNVSNSLAVIGVARWLGLPFSAVQESLAAFRGADRRLHFRGERDGIWVIDDYAHHPTEIRATLEACRPSGRRLVVVFQPHRFSRTQDLRGRMGDCFELAEEVYVMDVYSAGEQPIPGIDGQVVAEEIAARRPAQYAPDRTHLITLLQRHLTSGDTLLTLGAGDVWKIGEAFLD